MDLDEPKPEPTGAASLAKEDLEALSVFELEERIALLKTEITRAEVMIVAKQSSQNSAEDVFR